MIIIYSCKHQLTGFIWFKTLLTSMLLGSWLTRNVRLTPEHIHNGETYTQKLKG